MAGTTWKVAWQIKTQMTESFRIHWLWSLLLACILCPYIWEYSKADILGIMAHYVALGFFSIWWNNAIVFVLFINITSNPVKKYVQRVNKCLMHESIQLS